MADADRSPAVRAGVVGWSVAGAALLMVGGLSLASDGPPATGKAAALSPVEPAPFAGRQERESGGQEQEETEEGAGEEEPAGEEEQPPAEEEPPEGEEGEGPPDDASVDEGEGEGEGDEEEDSGPRLAGLAAAPTGILPGVEQAAPNPDPGNPVVALLLEDDGFVALSAGGRVVAYGPEGARPIWGLMDGGAAAIGRIGDAVAILERTGGIVIRRLADGRALATLEFSAVAPAAGDGAPNHGRLPGAGWFGGDSAALATDGSLSFRALPRGEPLFEVAFEAEVREEGGEFPPRIRAVAFEETRPADSPLAPGPMGGRGGPRRPFRRAVVSLDGGGLALVDAGWEVVRWRREDLGRITHPALILPEERLVVVGSAEGELHALRLDDGRTRWRRRLFEGFRHPPLASRGRLYAVSEANSVYCFDLRRGGERWRAALPGRPAGAPLRLAGALVVAIEDGLVVEFQPEVGSRIGRERRLDAEIAGVVRARTDGPGEEGWRRRRLYLGLRDGRLAVLGPRTSLAPSD